MAKKEYEVERNGEWEPLYATHIRVKGSWLQWRRLDGWRFVTPPGRWRERIPSKAGIAKDKT